MELSASGRMSDAHNPAHELCGAPRSSQALAWVLLESLSLIGGSAGQRSSSLLHKSHVTFRSRLYAVLSPSCPLCSLNVLFTKVQIHLRTVAPEAPHFRCLGLTSFPSTSSHGPASFGRLATSILTFVRCVISCVHLNNTPPTMR